MEIIEGLIIKQISFKESSKIIYLYTPAGPVSLLVHGAKKLSSPHLRLTENMNRIKCVATGKGLMTLTEGDILDTYPEIKADLEKGAYVSLIMELLMAFSESEYDHQKLYEFVVKILQQIEISKAYIRYVNMFELKFLFMLGISPNFKKCVVCGKVDGLQFSIKSGGYACKDHFPINETVYSETALDTIKRLYYHNLKEPIDLKIDQKTGQEIRYFLDEYYLYHLSFQSKSRKVLAGLLGY